MGSVQGNPSRGLPLPKVEQFVPVTLSEEDAHKLIAVADRPWHGCLVILLLTTGIRTAQELVGHSGLQTTVRYLHSDTRTKQTAFARLPKLLVPLGQTPNDEA